jgi:hypothetical protein
MSKLKNFEPVKAKLKPNAKPQFFIIYSHLKSKIFIFNNKIGNAVHNTNNRRMLGYRCGSAYFFGMCSFTIEKAHPHY